MTKNSKEYERELIEKLTELLTVSPESGLNDHDKERKYMYRIRKLLVKEACPDMIKAIALLTDDEAMENFDRTYIILESEDNVLVVDKRKLAAAVCKL